MLKWKSGGMKKKSMQVAATIEVSVPLQNPPEAAETTTTIK